MKNFFQNLLNKANSLESRIGLIAGALGILFFLFIVIHWNLKNKGFIYIQTYTSYEKTADPPLKEGLTWLEMEEQFEVSDNECIKKEQAKRNITAYSSERDIAATYKECITEIIPKKQISYYKLKSTFFNFLRHLFKDSYRGYSPYSWVMLILLISSYLLFNNLISKAINWIKTGRLI